jgi:Fe-S cluster assembly protein SufD
LRARLEAGITTFEQTPMPDPKEEDWRYVELGIDLDDFTLADQPGAALSDDETTLPVLGQTAGRALLVDGFPVSAEGDFVGLLTAADPEVWDLTAGPGIPAGLDRFSAAQHAFGSDAVVVRVPKGKAVAEPFLVEVQATTAATLVLPRVVVLAEEGSEASLVVTYRSPDGVALVAVPHVEVMAGPNARVGLTVVQDWGDETTGIVQQRMVADRDAALLLAEAGLGGRFSRLHLTIDLEGRGSDARVLSMYFGDSDQTLDYRAFMNHNAPNTNSNMFLKGAVGDTAASVFSGLIRIEPEGQKTNAHQTNRNLVLSEGAEAHSVPNLEILANDVRCGHGSAVGPLDAEQRYYLMSRGLDRARADRLQVKGFFEEVLAQFPNQALEPPLRTAAMTKYAGIMGRGTP